MWINEHDPAQRRGVLQAQNHFPSNAAIFENTIQHEQDI